MWRLSMGLTCFCTMDFHNLVDQHVFFCTGDRYGYLTTSEWEFNQQETWNLSEQKVNSSSLRIKIYEHAASKVGLDSKGVEAPSDVKPWWGFLLPISAQKLG